MVSEEYRFTAPSTTIELNFWILASVRLSHLSSPQIRTSTILLCSYQLTVSSSVLVSAITPCTHVQFSLKRSTWSPFWRANRHSQCSFLDSKGRTCMDLRSKQRLVFSQGELAQMFMVVIFLTVAGSQQSLLDWISLLRTSICWPTSSSSMKASTWATSSLVGGTTRQGYSLTQLSLQKTLSISKTCLRIRVILGYFSRSLKKRMKSLRAWTIICWVMIIISNILNFLQMTMQRMAVCTKSSRKYLRTRSCSNMASSVGSSQARRIQPYAQTTSLRYSCSLQLVIMQILSSLVLRAFCVRGLAFSVSSSSSAFHSGKFNVSSIQFIQPMCALLNSCIPYLTNSNNRTPALPHNNPSHSTPQQYKMGCQVVSVYSDEVAGAIGYPDPILQDLMRRDYASSNLLKQPSHSHAFNVQGFTQSFAQASLYTFVLHKKEHLVFSSGRFLIVLECGSLSQKALMHEDKIMALDVKGKLCAVGLIGGLLIVWDLQFLQRKVQVRMPSASINFSSIGLSSKYIFCTDTTQTANIVYCYDLRTTKLRAQSLLGSFQPTLKGVSWGSNCLVSAAADGVWYSRFDQSTESIQVTKGMFRIYPKTSMTCLSVVDETYVISGSIDGYIFLWAHLQCQRAIKVGDSAISQMLLHKEYLIVSNFNDNVRVFSYKITQKKNPDQDEKSNGEITEDFVTVIIDSYERPPLQAIAVSKLDDSIYYAQTRSGTLYQKMIPALQYFNKSNSYSNSDKTLLEYQRDSMKVIKDDCLWSATLNKPFFQITCSKIKDLSAQKCHKVDSRYISNAKNYFELDNPMFFVIPQLKSVCYLGEGRVGLMEMSRSDMNQDLKISMLKDTTILSYECEGQKAMQVLGIVSFQLSTTYVMVFFDHSYSLCKWDDGKWIEQRSAEYEGSITKQLQVEGKTIRFQQTSHGYRCKNQQFSEEQLFKLSFLHCMQDIECASLYDKQIVSVGADSLILEHKNAQK